MDIYCIDTSSLIEIKDRYPQDVTMFKKVWNNIENLYKTKRLIAPIEVLKEIEQGDDELKRWTKGKKIFVKPDKKQGEKIKEILEKYPFLANSEKPGPNADPWIIALAIVKNEEEKGQLFSDKKYIGEYIVVTEESKTRKDRIPSVCKNYNIECVNLIELFRREGW